MNASEKKVVQYLGEAHAGEQALAGVLQSQIATTPRGVYRTALEQHLRQTRDHAARVGERLRELADGRNPAMAAIGAMGTVVGQALALGKAPFDLLRGAGGEEQVLRNAKDAYASAAQEIATYTAIERLASSVGDDATAKLAASILADEEKMLQRVLREIPRLTDAVVRAEAEGDRSFGVSKTGAVASAGDLAIARYDQLTAEEITGRLAKLSRIDLAKIDSYERSHKNRAGVLKAADRELAPA